MTFTHSCWTLCGRFSLNIQYIILPSHSVIIFYHKLKKKLWIIRMEFLINLKDETYVCCFEIAEFDRSSSWFAFPRRVCVEHNFYRTYNRLDVGKKGEIPTAIFRGRKKKGGRATKGRRVIRQSGEREPVRRSDEEKLISRRLCRCTAPY